ncbi:MAG: HEAT repeat domain-containing protein [Elusimicrobiota bacterium]|jgi:hypothetical protein
MNPASLLAFALAAAPAWAVTENLQAVQKGTEIVITGREDAPPSEAEQEELDLSSKSVADLATLYFSAGDADSKLRVLHRLSLTEPRTGEDMRRLLDLHARDAAARSAADACLERLSPAAQGFGPYFAALLDDEDPLLRIFGLAGLRRLRYAPALPAVRKLAEGRFPQRRPSMLMDPAQNAEWRTRFEALGALAVWERKDALPLLLKKTAEAPAVASIVAALFWEEAFDRIVAWSKSKKAEDQEAAQAAWGADVAPEQLRPTWPKLLALALDKRADPQTRHRAAVKLGLAAGEAEAKTLLEKREAALKDKDERTRLLLESALFASGSPLAIPLLEEHARSNPAPEGRAGARLQLKGMLPRGRYLELLREAAEKDPDGENRAAARRELDAEGK